MFGYSDHRVITVTNNIDVAASVGLMASSCLRHCGGIWINKHTTEFAVLKYQVANYSAADSRPKWFTCNSICLKAVNDLGSFTDGTINILPSYWYISLPVLWLAHIWSGHSWRASQHVYPIGTAEQPLGWPWPTSPIIETWLTWGSLGWESLTCNKI